MIGRPATARETAVRARIDALRSLLPPSFNEFVVVGLSDQSPYGVVEHLLPALAMRLPRAERTALLRRLHELGGRSKVGRLCGNSESRDAHSGAI